MDLKAKLHEINIDASKRLVFISYHSDDVYGAGAEALIVKNELCDLLGIPEEKVFFAPHETTFAIKSLPNEVTNCEVLLLLQTKYVLTRPWVIVSW
jgi:hypothetical protein